MGRDLMAAGNGALIEVGPRQKVRGGLCQKWNAALTLATRPALDVQSHGGGYALYQWKPVARTAWAPRPCTSFSVRWATLHYEDRFL